MNERNYRKAGHEELVDWLDAALQTIEDVTQEQALRLEEFMRRVPTARAKLASALMPTASDGVAPDPRPAKTETRGRKSNAVLEAERAAQQEKLLNQRLEAASNGEDMEPRELDAE